MDLKNICMWKSHSSTNHKNKQETKKENSTVADSGCPVNFMTVPVHLNNVRPTTKIINENFPNGQIIRSTMEGESDLPMLLYIAR